MNKLTTSQLLQEIDNYAYELSGRIRPQVVRTADGDYKKEQLKAIKESATYTVIKLAALVNELSIRITMDELNK